MNLNNSDHQQIRSFLPVSRSVNIARSMSEIISVMVFLGGCAVLAGWVFNIAVLKSVYPGMVAMKANTAICFMLTGVSLWCLQSKRSNRPAFRGAAVLCASVVLLTGLATFCEFIYHLDLGIDQFFIKESSGAVLTPHLGRMAFNSAFNFVLIGCALLFYAQDRMKYVYVFQCLIMVVGYLSFLSLITYFYGALPFYWGGRFSSPVSVHGAVIFILSTLSLLFLRPEQGLVLEIHCDLTGGRILRRLLPIAITVPIVMGFLKIYATRMHLINNEFSVALVAMGNLTIITLYIYVLSVMLNRGDVRRKSLEISTEETKDRLEKIINAVADPIFVKDRKHRWILLNTAYSAFMGHNVSELLGKSDHEFFTKEQADAFWEKDDEVLSQGKEVLYEASFTDGNGVSKMMSVKKTLYKDNCGNRFIVGVIRDITQQKNLQVKVESQSQALEEALKEAVKVRKIMTSMLEDNNKIREDLEKRLVELKRSQNMLIHSEKLASLGRLISEITHEINNPLMIISGYAQLSLMSESLTDDDKNNLKIIVQECQRAKDVTKRVLRFSRISKGEMRPVDITQCLEGVVAIIERQFVLNYNVQIKRQYSDQLILVSMDEQQMHEVFMNLLNNAREAMSEGGVITVATSLEGMYVRIDFKDTGVGMSEEVMRKITEPYFTTKENGTGIGMGVCYSIIKAHNGELTYVSEVGKGSTVTVWLPLNGERDG